MICMKKDLRRRWIVSVFLIGMVIKTESSIGMRTPLEMMSVDIASIQVGVELCKESLDINRRRSGSNRRGLWSNIITIIILVRVPNPLIVNQVKLALPKGLLINTIGKRKRKSKIHGAINVLFKEDVGNDCAIRKGLDKIGMTVVYGIDHIGKYDLSEVDANIVSKTM
ncbi:hypothetical protein GQ457_08G024250 [Hibiscus cannabinus]